MLEAAGGRGRRVRAARRAQDAPAGRGSASTRVRPGSSTALPQRPRSSGELARRPRQSSVPPLGSRAVNWTSAADYEDIRYELSGDGIAKITINRPEVRNAFRPETLIEVSDALEKAREDTTVGVIILTGEGDKAFCSGGDQRVRGDTGLRAGRRRRRALPRDRPARPDPPAAEAGGRDGRGLRDRRRPRPAPRLRPHDRRRQRALRPDRPEGRLLRRRLRRSAALAGSSAPRRPRSSGCCAASTTRSRRSRWAW